MAAVVTIWQGFHIFAVVFTLLFSLVLLFEGIFTAYFGKGKSRKFGLALIAISLVIGTVLFVIAGPPGIMTLPLLEITVKAILYIGSGLLGALLALVIFLMLIVRI